MEVAQRAQGAFEVLRLRQDLVDEIDKRIGERIENLLRGPVLDNYRGFVCARFTNETSPLQAGQGGELEVWLQPERPAEEVPAEAIDIRDGRDFEQATFEIALDSDDIKFKPRRLTLTVQPDEASSRLFFPFVAPAKAGEHKVWVQVFQKNRLIQVVEATIQVEAKGD